MAVVNPGTTPIFLGAAGGMPTSLAHCLLYRFNFFKDSTAGILTGGYLTPRTVSYTHLRSKATRGHVAALVSPDLAIATRS